MPSHWYVLDPVHEAKTAKDVLLYKENLQKNPSHFYAFFSEGQIKVVHCYYRRKLRHSFSLLKSKLFNIVYIAESKHFTKITCSSKSTVDNWPRDILCSKDERMNIGWDEEMKLILRQTLMPKQTWKVAYQKHKQKVVLANSFWNNIFRKKQHCIN